MTRRIKRPDDDMHTRFDKLQRQVNEARQNTKAAVHDLCRAIVLSNGQLICALKPAESKKPAETKR